MICDHDQYGGVSICGFERLLARISIAIRGLLITHQLTVLKLFQVVIS
jgi:hypothetical protein